MKSIGILTVAIALGAAPSAFAQHLLLVQAGEGVGVVERVHGTTPVVQSAGASHAVRSGSLLLYRAPFYRDGYIKVEGFNVLYEIIASANVYAHVRGSFTSDRDLDHCFLVLEGDNASRHAAQFSIIELPDLRASKAVPFNATLQMVQIPNGIKVHVFSGRFECKHSMLGLDTGRTFSEDLAETASRNPAVLLRIAPNLTGGGAAKVRCRVGAEGEVVDATLVSADRQELGEAAVESVKQWLFVPAVRNHQYAEVTVDIPFKF